jgi:rubrerythrin
MTTANKTMQEGENYQALKGKTTIGEILEAACAFEHGAMVFYAKLKEQVGANLRKLVQELAEEERRHFELFQSMSKHPNVLEYISRSVTTPPSDKRFCDYIKTSPEFSSFADDKAILQYAIGREQAAMEQYSTLADDAPGGLLKDLFYYLAHEELQHKVELEQRYHELIQCCEGESN